METEREVKAKALRMGELEGLITEVETRLALNSGDPAQVATDRKARHWLMLEKEYYKRGHPFNTWPAMLAKMQESDRKSEAEAAERAKFAADNDPFILAKRAKAARTF